MVTRLPSICDSCVFYNEADNNCKAFPEGIPLNIGDTHFFKIPGQVGDTVYELDPEKRPALTQFVEFFDIDLPEELKE